MRIFGFSKKWSKLQQDTFTSFRYPRKDADKGRDWHIGETLKIVYHPRHEHEILGVAQITNIEDRTFSWHGEYPHVSELEAVADGFPGGIREMTDWIAKTYGSDYPKDIHKITFKWVESNR